MRAERSGSGAEGFSYRIGERTGNADLCAAVPNLAIKMGVRTIASDRLERLTPVAHHIAELVNINPHPQQT